MGAVQHNPFGRRAASRRLPPVDLRTNRKTIQETQEAWLVERGIPKHTILKKSEISFGAYVTVRGKKEYVLLPADSQFPSGVQLDTINAGTFCTVYKGKARGKAVAIKCPQQEHMELDPDMMNQRAIQEWRILANAKHPNVLGFVGGILHHNEIWLVTEFVPGGDLYTLLHCRVPYYLRPKTRLAMMIKISAAVAYLHSRMHPRVAHKDLKSNNIFVGEDLDIKLGDFGDAEEMRGMYLQCYTAATWQYTPPEIIAADDPSQPQGATEKVDVWALGCIFLEICRQPTPFKHLLDGVPEVLQRDKLREFLPGNQLSTARRIPTLPCSLRGLISSCLLMQSPMRPSALEVNKYLTDNYDRLLDDISNLQASFECGVF